MRAGLRPERDVQWGMPRPRSPKLALATTTALVAFAANSLFCRAALRTGGIDPYSFTLLRLASGALLLGTLAHGQSLRLWERGGFVSAAALMLYALPFSMAYVELSAGTGALILFGSVQLTMIGWSLYRGERPHFGFWCGMPLAFAGLLGLTLPGASAPSLRGALLMAASGVGWGIYSLLGQRAGVPPLQATARAFILASLVAVVGFAARGVYWPLAIASSRGILFACASGALASGLGYALWYVAMRSLSGSAAALLQLLVPALAATGGVVLLGEALTVRLALCGGAILAGVAMERSWPHLLRLRGL